MDKVKQQELDEIESQLSFPTGENGIEMAKMMNDTNIKMTLETIKALNIEDHNCVLELGHGNCEHLKETVNQAKDIRFTGLEISETMYEEAQRINVDYLDNTASFHLYDGEHIPFENEMFDRIMTVNTLYFWKDPKALLNQIYRVLKPNGNAAITFAKEEFMKNLPFVQGKFELYNNQKAQNLVNMTNLNVVEILDKSDDVKSKLGEMVNRQFSIMILKK